MKLEKAIEGSSDAAFRLEREGFEEWAKAVGLGKEALKVIKQGRPFGYVALDEPLPGETQE